MSSGEPIRVYFVGSGGTGVPVLAELAQAPDLELVGVATQPDRPAGRHGLVQTTAVGALAEGRAWDVAKPLSVNDPVFLAALRERRPDVVVVVSFGQILKADLLSLPRFGCLNVHASLLPRHRGASPVSAAILAGDEETGVSLMRMDKGLDTGPVYRQIRLPLDGTETAEALEAGLGRLAAAHVVDCVQGVCRRGELPVPQPAAGVTYARKLAKTDGAVDWARPARLLERQVRAYSPWPRAWFMLPGTGSGGSRRVQITAARVVPTAAPATSPGEVLRADAHEWRIACGGDALVLERVIPEGRKEMTAGEFLRGCRVLPGTRLPGGGPTATVQPSI